MEKKANELKKELFYLSQDKIDLDDKYDEAVEFISNNNSNSFAASLVLEELFVNVMNYAYKEKGDGPILVRIEKDEEGVHLYMIDYGIPFNPVERANWMAHANQIGGRGIDLVKSYSRKFEYKNVYNTNMVHVYI